MSWIIEKLSGASATNSIMNLCHTLFVIAGAKALCFVFCSSGNIQIKYYSGPVDPLFPPPTPSATLSWQKPQYLEG